MIYIIDSFAILKLIQKETGYEKILKIIDQAKDNKVKLMISGINFGEVLYRLTQIKGQKYFEKIEQTLRAMPITISQVDDSDIILAAKFKSRGGVSYADCFAIALAQKTKGVVLTGDDEFKKFENEVKIEWI